jgi:hypothetical protein
LIPIFVPQASKKEWSKYVYRMERAANITVVQNIFCCPYLVIDGIFVPDSYIDFIILYMYLI